DIIKECKCPECKGKLYFSDQHNKINNLKVTFLRLCNFCHIMFIYSGRYKTEESFDKALKFFSKTVYRKYREYRKEKNKRFLENIKNNPKRYGIDVKEKKGNKLNNVKGKPKIVKKPSQREKKKNSKIAIKPNLREEYRRRKNVRRY
ncbi:hypothetical protein LCGC14_2425770, partial [marine sediment metagenome]